jgi:carboxyl-terminal processing protease
VPAVFVLIDQGSASASEILAAALRDNIGAKLIGMNSFGKGTIQDAKEFSDGAGVHITVAKWLTPKKEWIHKIGLSPDEKVELTEENTKDGADPQLEKALELAKEF